MAITQRMQQRIAQLATQLSEELGEADEGEGDCWLDAIENRAVELGDAITRSLLAQQSSHRTAQSHESTCPQCGKTGRYVGDRQRELISRRGPVTITEPEYYCPACRRAFFPDDPGDWC